MNADVDIGANGGSLVYAPLHACISVVPVVIRVILSNQIWRNSAVSEQFVIH